MFLKSHFLNLTIQFYTKIAENNYFAKNRKAVELSVDL